MRQLLTTCDDEPLLSDLRAGRDELNLAEFPMALLTDRVTRGQKTFHFEDSHGRLTVTGSDAHGLPKAIDADVIVALIYLTKQRTNFRDAKVNFSLTELIRLLHWTMDGRSFQRLRDSFSRWIGVSLHYDRCWWNNRLKAFTSAQMHIIESVELIGKAGNSGRGSGRVDWEPSSFTWNRKFIESCQAENLRQLDLETYFALRSAISKRLYRFLGKRFHLRADWTFDLGEIAFERVGLSRSYRGDAGKIKEKLQPALTELESIGFLVPMDRETRYTRVDRGRWAVRVTWQGNPTPVESVDSSTLDASPSTAVDSPLVAALVGQGITQATAIALVATHPADRIQLQLDVLAWQRATTLDGLVDPVTWLLEAIGAGHAAPRGFTAQARRRRPPSALVPAPRGDATSAE